MDAAKLLQGLELYTAGKDTEAVAGTRDYLVQRPAYNLTVDRTHTYFVGRGGVLVHNSGCKIPDGFDGNWTHILYGDFKNGFRGYHHNPGGVSPIGRSLVKTGRERGGFYEAMVSANGVDKEGKGLSTFFPDSWSQDRVINVIKSAYIHRKGQSGEMDLSKILGSDYSGVSIKIIVDANGNIKSAYPVIK